MKTNEEVNALIAATIKMCADRCAQRASMLKTGKSAAFQCALDIRFLTPADAQKALDDLLTAERERAAQLVDHILKEGGGTYGDAIRTL